VLAQRRRHGHASGADRHARVLVNTQVSLQAPAHRPIAARVDQQPAQRPRAAHLDADALRGVLGQRRQQAARCQRPAEGHDLDPAQPVAFAGLGDQTRGDGGDDPQREVVLDGAPKLIHEPTIAAGRARVRTARLTACRRGAA
jgi:hypothetical protein